MLRQTYPIQPESILPATDRVLALQGVPAGRTMPPQVDGLLKRAIGRFLGAAKPVALLQSTSRETVIGAFFDTPEHVQRSPVARAVSRAQRLALFAVTLGPQPENAVDDLFAGGNLGLAAMLDAVASAAAEAASDVCARTLFEELHGGSVDADSLVLGYSPGYCGWAVDAQRVLWRLLRPDEIGIQINDSCMMMPRKSVSGILVAGDVEIHRIGGSAEVCRSCAFRACEMRLRGARRETTRGR